MNRKLWNEIAVIWLSVVSVASVSSLAQGGTVILDGNYDGLNFNLSRYDIGRSSGYTFAWGARFTVAGSGDFDLDRVTLPLVVLSGTPDPNNYLLSLVSDNRGSPSDDVLWSATPQGVGGLISSANCSFDASGVVRGGSDYWLLFTPVAPDEGRYGWFFSVPPGTWDSGLAERWSDVGPPAGAWVEYSGLPRPAFLVEGTAVVPEPGFSSLLGLGLAGWIVRGCRCCRTIHSS